MFTRRLIGLAAALLAAMAVSAPAANIHPPHPVLQFVKQIGVGGGAWMSLVAFSPDGTMVASNGPAAEGDMSGDLTVWNFADGRLLKRLPGQVYSLSRDWKYYATWRMAGNSFVTDFRSVETGQPITPPPKNELTAGGEISPDGTVLAKGHWDLIGLRNAKTGKRLAVLRGFGRYVTGIAFSKNGRLLAAGTDYGDLQIWDVRRHRRLHSLHIDGGYVSEPAFSPDGRLVAVGIYGTGTVWVVDTRTGKLVDQQKVSDLGCGSVAFSPDGRYLITPSTGGLITWPYDEGGTIRVFRVKYPGALALRN
jgi:WD40 repeat protein